VIDERESYREDIDTVECAECGQAHLWCSEGLLEGMELGALMEAEARLSSKGMETLKMVGQAGEHQPPIRIRRRGPKNLRGPDNHDRTGTQGVERRYLSPGLRP
jgi:hypothetical protein